MHTRKKNLTLFIIGVAIGVFLFSVFTKSSNHGNNVEYDVSQEKISRSGNHFIFTSKYTFNSIPFNSNILMLYIYLSTQILLTILVMTITFIIVTSDCCMICVFDSL